MESGTREWRNGVLEDLYEIPPEDERQQLKRVTFVFAPAYIRDSGENPEFMKVSIEPADLLDTRYSPLILPCTRVFTLYPFDLFGGHRGRNRREAT